MDRRQFTMFGLVAAVRLLGQQSCEAPVPDGKKATFTKSQVADRVKQIVAQQLGVEPSKVTDTARFVEDLKADSLDLVELTMAFEEAFDIEVSEEECGKVKTVGDAVKAVTELLRSEKRITDESSWLKNGEFRLLGGRASGSFLADLGRRKGGTRTSVDRLVNGKEALGQIS